MELVRKIIANNKHIHDEFEYYLLLIGEAEKNLNTNPDICIECCKSVIEGISKPILKKLDKSNEFDDERIDGMKPVDVFEKALVKLKECDDNLNIDIIRNLKEYLAIIVNIRNKRCDLAHGRLSPKIQESDKILSQFIFRITESIANYILSIFYEIDLSEISEVPYDENEEFNDELDSKFDLDGVVYSKALYEQDYSYYEELLRDWESGKEENQY